MCVLAINSNYYEKDASVIDITITFTCSVCISGNMFSAFVIVFELIRKPLRADIKSHCLCHFPAKGIRSGDIPFRRSRSHSLICHRQLYVRNVFVPACARC